MERSYPGVYQQARVGMRPITKSFNINQQCHKSPPWLSTELDIDKKERKEDNNPNKRTFKMNEWMHTQFVFLFIILSWVICVHITRKFASSNCTKVRKAESVT